MAHALLSPLSSSTRQNVNRTNKYILGFGWQKLVTKAHKKTHTQKIFIILFVLLLLLEYVIYINIFPLLFWLQFCISHLVWSYIVRSDQASFCSTCKLFPFFFYCYLYYTRIVRQATTNNQMNKMAKNGCDGCIQMPIVVVALFCFMSCVCCCWCCIYCAIVFVLVLISVIVCFHHHHHQPITHKMVIRLFTHFNCRYFFLNFIIYISGCLVSVYILRYKVCTNILYSFHYVWLKQVKKWTQIYCWIYSFWLCSI